MAQRSNRTVYARVRALDGTVDGHVEQVFEDRNWPFQPKNSKSGEYVVAVPVYSSKGAAVQAARRALTEISTCHVPLFIDELRLLNKPVDERRPATVR